ncbi:MAG: MFS transporter [Allosphingosinicella sp.]|uniref:MFS transporter n=1 Tax=Allosphingosinicella sp. TaxID=2823234 RepID=UPI00394ACEEB
MARLEGSAADEWRRGWSLPIVAALGYGLGNVFGHSFGVFVQPIEREFGWTRGEISSAFTVISLVLALFLPLVGRLIDRLGPRRIAIPGAIAYCCAIAALGLTGPSLLSWWGLWALVGIAAVTVQAPVWTSAVSSRFNRSRGTALAITFCGGAITTTFLPILGMYLIAELGWRGAYAAMAAICAVVVIPLVALAFYDARDVGESTGRSRAAPVRQITGEEIRTALRSRRFVRLAVASFCLMIGITALLIHFVPILSSVGLTTAQAAGAASLIGIGSLLGRLLCGYLLDRISGSLVGAVAFGLPAAVAGALMLFDGGLGGAMAIAFLFGMCVGGEVDVLAYLTGRHFGLTSYGTLFGILVAIQNLAYAIGPPLAGILYDRTGGYDLFLAVAIPLFLTAALLVALLGPYPEAEEHQAEAA